MQAAPLHRQPCLICVCLQGFDAFGNVVELPASASVSVTSPWNPQNTRPVIPQLHRTRAQSQPRSKSADMSAVALIPDPGMFRNSAWSFNLTVPPGTKPDVYTMQLQVSGVLPQMTVPTTVSLTVADPKLPSGVLSVSPLNTTVLTVHLNKVLFVSIFCAMHSVEDADG